MDTTTRAVKRANRFVFTKSHPVCSSMVSEKRQITQATAMVRTKDIPSGMRVKIKEIIAKAGSSK